MISDIPQVNILQKSVIYARYRVSGAKFLPTRFWGKILRKTSNLGQNFAKDDSTGWKKLVKYYGVWLKKV